MAYCVTAYIPVSTGRAHPLVDPNMVDWIEVRLRLGRVRLVHSRQTDDYLLVDNLDPNRSLSYAVQDLCSTDRRSLSCVRLVHNDPEA